MKLTLSKAPVLLLELFLVFLNFLLCSSYSFVGNTITDLTSTDANFYNEAAAWTLSSYYSSAKTKVSVCGSDYLLGGYAILGGSLGEYFQRVYTGIPAHNLVTVGFDFHPLDSWDGADGGYNGGQDHFEFALDGTTYYGWRLSIFDRYATQLCGGPWADFPPFQVYVDVPHSGAAGSSITLRFINMLDQGSDDESFGFRNVKLVFSTVSSPKYTICGISPGSPLPDKQCGCTATNMYEDPPNSGYCITCNPACKTCSGGTANDCTSCPAGQYLANGTTCVTSCNSPLSSSSSNSITYCNTPCPTSYAYWDSSCSSTCTAPLQPTTYNTYSLCTYKCDVSQYLYWNGTCAGACLTPYSKVVTKNRNFCNYPCTGSDILYWNTTCKSSCPSPLKTRYEASKYYCDYPCLDSEFLYWNGSCKVACSLPLKPRIESSKNYCDYPCTSGYLYWNGSCISSCLLPFSKRQEAGKDYCDYPCIGSDILYWNGSCIGSCLFPLKTRLEVGKYYCDYPCSSGYLYWNGSCISSCIFPLSPRSEAGKDYCDYKCTGSDILYWNGSCINSCPFPLTTRLEMGKYFCDYPCASSENLYWNGSCKATCPSPLSTRVEAGKNYCDYQCTGSDILYWNKSCISTCPFPLSTRKEVDKYFCVYPCQTTQYLYFNGSCLDSCSIPLKFRSEASRNYCDYPCVGTQTLRWDGTCLESCTFPLKGRVEASKDYCDYPCQLSQRLFWNGSCLTDSDCPFPLSKRTEASRQFCDYPCSGTQYLYWNGSCKASCGIPFSGRISYGDRYCDYPCTASQSLYWDGMCSGNCASPLVPKTEGSPIVKDFCTYPCKMNEFLYWNGTCSTICKFPLKVKIQNSRLFCEHPCKANEYLYWNGSCIGSCDLPFSPETDASSRKYCNYPCASSEYLYWNGTCLSTCTTPLSPRSQGSDKFCDFVCDPNDFVYWDGSCSSDCLSPLTPTIVGTTLPRKFCVFGCEKSEVLYWNGECSDECNGPLVEFKQNNRRFCQYTCDTGDYLYWNGTCKSSCDMPLASREEDGKKYCDYKCSNSEYLYWNSTCIATCEAPLTKRLENGKNYCDFSCGSDEYLYYNGSCLEKCPTPFTPKIEGDTIKKNFCTIACQDDEFLHWNGSCLANCSSPYNIVKDGNYKFCNLPCNSLSLYYYTESGTCSQECPSSSRVINDDEIYLQCTPIPPPNVTATLFNMFLDAPLQSGTLTIVKVVKAMQYMRYLDIKLPPRLQRFGVSRGRNVATMGSGARILNDMQANLLKETLPSVFAKHNFQSSFLDNFWDTLLFLAAAIASGIVCYLFEKIAQRAGLELLEAIFMRLRIITKWNLFLMMLATSIDDIILYSSIEFRTVQISSDSAFSDHLGLVLCVVFLILTLSLMVFTFYLIEKLQKTRRSVLPQNQYNQNIVEEFNSKWQDFQVLFRGFRDHHSLNEYFFLIYTIRIGLPMLITVCATSKPLVVIGSQVITNTIILIYMLKMQPFKKMINLVQLVLYELVVFLMNLGMLALVIFSVYDVGNDDVSVVIGDIIIICNDALNILTIPFCLIKIKQEFDVIRRLQKARPEKGKIGKARYVQLLSLIFQQANMGFEEMIEEGSNEIESEMKLRHGALSTSQGSISKTDKQTKNRMAQARKVVPFSDNEQVDTMNNKSGTSNFDLTSGQQNNTYEDLFNKPRGKPRSNLTKKFDNQSQKQESDPFNIEFSPTVSPSFDSSPTNIKLEAITQENLDLTQGMDNSPGGYKRNIRRLLKMRSDLKTSENGPKEQ